MLVYLHIHIYITATMNKLYMKLSIRVGVYKKKQTMHYDRSKQVLAGGKNDE